MTAVGCESIGILDLGLIQMAQRNQELLERENKVLVNAEGSVILKEA